MEFRSIKDLEQLETLPDDAQILIIDNNTAKRISKANAKFGGGAMVVTFTFSENVVSADKTVEEVTTAMASMPVIGNIIMVGHEGSIMMPLGPCFLDQYNSSETPTPAFGPFIKSSKRDVIIGTIGVNYKGQWVIGDKRAEE